MSAHRAPQSSGASHTHTPYKDFLHTNFVPSDDECRRIRDLVVAPMKELEDATEEIARLRATFAQLTRKRDRLAEFIDSHLALVSGARRLPHDIMQEIFTASLPHDYASMTCTESPLLLTHICREWRSLALSMPRLWTSLQLREPYNSFLFNSTRLNKGVQSWLKRSGGATGLPLSISYSSMSNDTRKPPLILQTLIKCSPRWEHMRLDLPSFEHCKPLKDLSEGDVTLLRTIVIGVGGRGDQDTPDFFSFIRAKNIRAVSLKYPSGLQALISSDHLCHLSLPHILLAEALAMLQQSPNLETCTLATSHRPEDVLPTSNQIYMERMQRLCVIDNTYKDNTRLFDHIVLPNLQSFEYLHDMGDPIGVLASLHAPDKLTSLSLSTSFSMDALAEGLRRFPMLQKLFLHCPRESLAHNGVIGCELFTLLSPPPQVPAAILCPHLERICSLGLDVGSDQELLALIHARRAADGIQPLSRLHVVFPREQQVDITPQLISAGVTATLRYPTDDELRFIHAPRLKMVAQRSISRYARPAEWAPKAFKRDPDADWGPISGGWGVQYAEWGLTPDKN